MNRKEKQEKPVEKNIYSLNGYNLLKREYIADVTWYYNMPSLKHNKKVDVDAYDSNDATDKAYRAYPNVLSCVISEKNEALLKRGI